MRVILALALIWIIFQIQEDRFLTAFNLTNLVLQITAVGLISVGIVLVLLLGEIDLSVGAVSGLAAVVMAVLNVKHGWSPYPAIAAGLVAGSDDRAHPGASCSPGSASRRSWSPWPACWPGRARCSRCWARPGTVNITDSKITGLTGTFYCDTSGWIIAVVCIAAVRARHAGRPTPAIKAGLPTAPLAGARSFKIVHRGRGDHRHGAGPQRRPRRAAGRA